MERLYLKVEITSKTVKEQTEYYIIKEKRDGVQIVQKDLINIGDKTEIIFQDISNYENLVENIIDTFIASNNDLEQMKYIIEDSVKNQETNVVA